MKKYFYLLSLVAICTGCAKPQSDVAPDDTGDVLIVGGRSVTKKSDIANMIVSLVDTGKGTLCTASILYDDIALTAAHCVDGDATNMMLSFGSRTSGKVVRRVVRYATTTVWAKHQQQSVDTGDIALIQFAGGLPAGAEAVTIMPAKHHLANGEEVTLAGFGISNGKTDKGEGILRSVEVKIANAKFSRTEVSLDQTEKKGACHGDSGGPAFVEDGEALALWGVTSRGVNDPADECNGLSVYTRVQPYIRWMNSTIKSWD